MKTMFIGAVALAALAASPAAAQPATAPMAPMAPMAAHPITRADFMQRLHAHFAKLDANHDGFVDRAEASAGMGGMHEGPAGATPGAPHMRMDPSAMFDAMDANHDGTISRSEFLAFHASARHRDMAGMAHGDGMHGPMAGPDGARASRPGHAGLHMGLGGRWFDRLDSDHDGRVSLAEAERGAAAMFDRLDANHDGTISPDEHDAARGRMHERMDAHPGQ